MSGQYPTKEQAAAAATHVLGDIGDRVYLHQDSCSYKEDYEACDCTEDIIELTSGGWRFLAVGTTR